MRLLKSGLDGEVSLTTDLIDKIPAYAILSHTWGPDEDEVTFDDIERRQADKKPGGYEKLQFCRRQAEGDGLRYFWVDTCCINKANHSELSEAINSMFRWYRDAAKCYVYLSDVSATSNNNDTRERTWEQSFHRSRLFRRGWTLQELLAPTSVDFFSREGTYLGSKKTLVALIHGITNIPIIALQGKALSHFPIHERFGWAAGRNTKKPEDGAYSLLGIFNVFMPLIYGEGQNAFQRLEDEISRQEQRSYSTQRQPYANSPAAKQVYNESSDIYHPLESFQEPLTATTASGSQYDAQGLLIPQNVNSLFSSQTPIVNFSTSPDSPLSLPPYSRSQSYHFQSNLQTFSPVTQNPSARLVPSHARQRSPNVEDDYNNNGFRMLCRTISDCGITNIIPLDSPDLPIIGQAAYAKSKQFARQHKIPLEVAADLVPLALFEVVILIENSSSMLSEEHGSRLEDLKFALSRISEAALLFTSKVAVRCVNTFFSANSAGLTFGDNLKTKADINRVLQKIKFAGSAPVGEELKDKVIDGIILPRLRSRMAQKPFLVYVLTDTPPSGDHPNHNDLVNTICYAHHESVRSLGASAVFYQFWHIGSNERMLRILKNLEWNPIAGPLIDHISGFELEQRKLKQQSRPVDLTTDVWIKKGLIGAIDRSYQSIGRQDIP